MYSRTCRARDTIKVGEVTFLISWIDGYDVGVAIDAPQSMRIEAGGKMAPKEQPPADYIAKKPLQGRIRA